MITPSFGVTATERVLPRLALDFTTASLDPRITFTRTTDALNPATYTNSSGVITEAADNQPRFDYDPITLVCKGLLIEESRANLLTQSSDFSVNWSKANLTVNTTATTAPDGTLTGNLVFAATGIGQLTRNFTATSTAHTFSIFVKKGPNNPVTSTWVLRNATTSTNLAQVSVTWATMTFTSNIGGTANTWVNVGNGWWRVTLSVSSGITIGNTITPYALGAMTQGFDVYIWGSQLEVGAFATSYIPTTSAALTRNADVAVMTGTNFSDWFNASEGTVFAQFSMVASTSQYVFRMTDGTGTNEIRIIGTSSGGTGVRMDVLNGGAAQATVPAAITPTANQTYQVVGAYKANDFAGSRDGGTTSTDVSGSIPTVNQATIGNLKSGHVKQIMYWPQRLTNAEVQSFSK